MSIPKRMEFIFGGIAMSFSPKDIEIIWCEWEREHPGKIATRDMPPDEFAARCMDRLRANARPTRTVLHN